MFHKICGKIDKLSDWNKNWCGSIYMARRRRSWLRMERVTLPSNPGCEKIPADAYPKGSLQDLKTWKDWMRSMPNSGSQQEVVTRREDKIGKTAATRANR